MDSGLLIARVVLGLLMAAHGSQKLFGWLGGYGIAGTGGFMETLGFRPGRLFAAAAGVTEFAGGLLVALGLLGPIGPAMIVSVMIVAALTVHWRNGLFFMTNGIEPHLLYVGGAVALALTGPGAYSLDELLGLSHIWTPGVEWLALVAGVLVAVTNLALRRVEATSPAAA